MRPLVTARQPAGRPVLAPPRRVWTPQRGIGCEPRALRIKDNTGGIKCTTYMPDIWALTACGWAYLEQNLLGGVSILFELEKNDDSYFNSFFFYWSDPIILYFGNSGNYGDSSFANVPVPGRWFFFAMTGGPWNGGAGVMNAYWAYAGASSFNTLQHGAAEAPPASEYFSFGNDVNNEYLDGRFACMKVWDATLTPAELAREMYSPFPVSRLNKLNRFLNPQFPGDGRDYSGAPGARSATTAGTWGAAGPPIFRYNYATPRAQYYTAPAVTSHPGYVGSFIGAMP